MTDTTFLSLPVELRLNIYNYIFPTLPEQVAKHFSRSSSRAICSKTKFAILLTCRQVLYECKDVAFQRTIFHITEHYFSQGGDNLLSPGRIQEGKILDRCYGSASAYWDLASPKSLNMLQNIRWISIDQPKVSKLFIVLSITEKECGENSLLANVTDLVMYSEFPVLLMATFPVLRLMNYLPNLRNLIYAQHWRHHKHGKVVCRNLLRCSEDSRQSVKLLRNEINKDMGFASKWLSTDDDDDSSGVPESLGLICNLQSINYKIEHYIPLQDRTNTGCMGIQRSARGELRQESTTKKGKQIKQAQHVEIIMGDPFIIEKFMGTSSKRSCNSCSKVLTK